MDSPCLLAIVIPAFKKQFLHQALQSIASQTNQNFNLYIGDDNSPEDIFSIVKDFEPNIKINYHRFNDNLGSISLTKQWERCINLSKEEPYIWVFSDDDIMPPDAVERFYQTIKIHKNFPVYRFNLAIINADQIYTGKDNPYIELETGFAFIQRRLEFKVNSAIIEFVFSREAYKKYNGFVDFPLAWGSDTATMALFANHSHIYTITGDAVLWRTTNSINISSSDKFNKEKLQAQLLFINWLREIYPDNFYDPYFRHLVFNYLMGVCGKMLKGKLSYQQIFTCINTIKILYGRYFASIFSIQLILYLKIFLKYKSIRRSFVSLVK